MKPAELIAERFEIERLAGWGGMGDVYSARDRLRGARVAIKVLQRQGERSAHSAAERFAREAETLSGLEHPAIVKYIAHGRTAEGRLWLAMEWLEGEDLAARLTRSGLTVRESVALGLRVAAGLAAAHGRGIVHRDIKPSNLFLCDGRIDRIKIVDFGIARRAQSLAATRAGALLGTPAYMAPEQARGGRELDARADVFSLGCVLFECLTGTPAFAGEHAMAILAKILLEEAPRASELGADVPDQLDDLIARMLSKEPAGRPRDGATVANELARLGAADGGSPSRVSGPPASLGAGEQRLLCAVLAAPAGGDDPRGSGEAATLTPEQADATATLLRAVAEQHGGRLEPLAGGSVVAIFSATGAATDLVARAARCALAMRAKDPAMPMALATGRGVLTDRWPVGEVIDRAAGLLRGATKGLKSPVIRPGSPLIRIDDVTAGLLSTRFDVGGDAAGLDLRGERDTAEAARTLLGKATPCVGRERELRVIEDLFAGCVEEPQARAVLVTAPPGVGKSRLVSELCLRLERRGEPVTIWRARGDPMSAGSPFGMIAPALRRAAGILDSEPLVVRRHKLRAWVGLGAPPADVPRIAAFLGELVGSGEPDLPDRGARDDELGAPSSALVQLRAARRDPMLMGDQMRRAFEDMLAAETSMQPLVIVLDDLQWGDLPSVKYLDSALRNLSDRPLLVLGVARPDVHDLFPALFAGRALHEIRLTELTRKNAEKLTRAILGDTASADTIARLVERAAGNTFYLEELIRAAAAGRGDELPETVLAMVEARIEALEPEARRVLRAASVYGQIFWGGAVMSLLGGAQRTIEVRDYLEELAQREIITPARSVRFPAEREFSFRHSLFRDAAYATLTDRDRRLGHELAGRWLERAGEGEPVVLAEHFERGGDPGRALGWYRRAAEQALGGNDFTAAITRAERAIACGATGEVLGALRFVEAEAHVWRGEMEAAEARGSEALALLPAGSAPWCSAAGELAMALSKLGRYAELERLLAAVLALGEARVEAHHVAVWARLAAHLFTAGKLVEAEALLDRIDSSPAAEGAIDPASQAWIDDARSWRATYREDTVGSVRWEERALARFEEAGDLRNACHARVGLGVAYREIGAYAEAERLLRDAAATAERIGLGRVRATAMHNLGPVLAIRGAVAEGRAAEEAAVAEFAAERDPRMLGGARYYLALILIRAGDLDAAEREARAAIAISPETSEVFALAHATLAFVLLAKGRSADALAAARRAADKLERLGRLEEGEPLVRLALAEALHAADLRDEARAAIVTARERLLTRAARIGEPALRESFLAQPDNARTLALAEAWIAVS